jgi:hypothetical protein
MIERIVAEIKKDHKGQSQADKDKIHESSTAVYPLPMVVIEKIPFSKGRRFFLCQDHGQLPTGHFGPKFAFRLVRILSFFIKDVMRRNLSFLLTLATILGLLPRLSVAAPQCSVVFEQPTELNGASVQESIIDQLKDLKTSLQELRSELKEVPGRKNRLKVLESLDEDPREIAYVLQGAYRLVLAHPLAEEILAPADLKALKKGLKEMKWLEKTLGTYQVQSDLYKTAKKIKVAEDFQEFLARQRNRASDEAIEQLKSREFLDSEISAVTRHIQKLKRWDDMNVGRSRSLIQESLKSELDRVYEKVENEMKPLILKDRYTYKELEEGAHAFRRSLRWIRVYLQAYPELFTNMNKKEFNNLSRSIDELRKIKKPGEMREKMVEALAAYGQWNGIHLNVGETLEHIEPLMEKKFENIEAKTQEILEFYETRNGFRGIIKETP